MKVKRFGFTLLAAAALALFGLALAASSAQAGPAAPGDRVVTQPDGTEVTVRVWGDEWNHGLETAEGFTVMEDAQSGYLVYAEVQPDGSLAPAMTAGRPLVVGRDAPAGLAPRMRPAPQARPERSLGPIRQQDGPNLQSFQGSMPVLVILAQFQNQKANVLPGSTTPVNIPVTYWRDLFFGTTHSLRDFYSKASFGKLTLSKATESFTASGGATNDGVVGWVNLPMNHPDGSSSYATSSSVARNALTAANSYVNFASYDKNKDGYVTGSELQVVIIAAGYEGSYDGYAYRRVWAHQWDLDDAPLTLDGVRLAQNSPSGLYGGYSILGEMFNRSEDWNSDGVTELYTPLQMGTPTHEFGHLLSWPDLYDSDLSSEGVGEWSLMGSASWNYTSIPGDTPGLPDAFLKWYQGWITPAKAESGERSAVAQASDNSSAYLVGVNQNGVDWSFYRQRGQGQYWLVENRQRSGYDSGLPGCGLLVWHIDERVTYTNGANANDYDPLVELEQADGTHDLYWGTNRGDTGDPWPGYYNKTVLNDSTGGGEGNPDLRTYERYATSYSVSVEPGYCQPTMYFTATIEQPYEYHIPGAMRWGYTASGTVTDNGAAVSGQRVKLYVSPAAAQPYYLAASATTDSTGRYSMVLPAGHGYTYYVAWDNPSQSTYNNRLFNFLCSTRTFNNSSSTCSFNIRDVKMLEPASGATVTHPFTFIWQRRTTTTDNYVVQLFYANQDFYTETPELGYADRVTLAAAPDGAKINTTYLWSMKVLTPDGEGYAYYARPIKWSDLSGPPAGPEFGPVAPWQPGTAPQLSGARPIE